MAHREVRVMIYLSAEDKELIEQAAQYTSEPVSSYIRRVAVAASKEALPR